MQMGQIKSSKKLVTILARVWKLPVVEEVREISSMIMIQGAVAGFVNRRTHAKELKVATRNRRSLEVNSFKSPVKRHLTS